MSKRPGTQSRLSGCFFLVFFGFFFAFPMFFLWALLNGEKVEGDVWVAWIIIPVFMLVGLGGMYAGIRTLLGKGGQKADKGNAYSVPTPAKAPRPTANGYYKLKPELGHKATCAVLIFATLFWNGITWLAMGRSVFSEGKTDIGLLIFFLIFAAIGLVLIYASIHSLLRIFLTGETSVSTSSAAATPGQKLNVIINQAGSFTVTRLAVTLICEEEAKYRRGTDTITKRETVVDLTLCDRPDMRARNGQVLTQESLTIPPGAMHSFEASNNKIMWFIQVTMEIPSRPDIKQRFVLPVLGS